MIKFKKILAAAMTGAMLLGVTAVAAAPAVNVYADETPAYTINVDYTNFVATITTANSADAYIILQVLKDSSGSKVTGTYTYEVVGLTGDYDGQRGAVVDLSFLKIKKDAYIRAYGSSVTEKSASQIKTVNAQLGKFSMKYTSGKDTLVAALTINKGAATANALDAFEYRTLYGSTFIPLTTLDPDSTSTDDDVFRTLEVAGTTLIVRKHAVEDTAADTGNNVAAVAGAPASPEVKVKISAAPKAPKVTIDYAKGTVKLPKNAELQLISADDDGNAAVTAWVESSKTVVDQSDILKLFFKVSDDGIADNEALQEKIAELTASGFTVAVHTTKSGKADSNPTILTVPPAATLAKTDDKDEVKIGSNSLTWKTTDKGIEYTVTGSPFEYKDGDKWKTLKVGTTTVKGLVSADKEVEVRVAGVKATNDKAGTLPSSSFSISVTAYKAPVENITVTLNPSTVQSSASSTKTAQATAVAKDKDGNPVSDVTITWSIKEDTSKVTIDESGEITVAKGTSLAGEYTITATCGEKTGTATLTVE